MVLFRCLFRSFWWCHWSISPWRSYGLGTGWIVGLLTVLARLTSVRKHRCMSIWQDNYYFYYWIFYTIIRPWGFWHNVCLAVQATVLPVFIVHFWWMQQKCSTYKTCYFYSSESHKLPDIMKKIDKYENLLKRFPQAINLLGQIIYLFPSEVEVVPKITAV